MLGIERRGWRDIYGAMMKEGVGSIEPFSDSMGETYSNNRRRLGGDGGGGGSGVRPSQVNKVADGQMEHILSRFAQVG